MKVTIRATYWSKELKKGLPILRMEPENAEEKKLCKEIMKQGCDYGSSFKGCGKESNLIDLEVVLTRIK